MENGGWDWEWFYFLGTVKLLRSDREFWALTPRQFFSLVDMNNRFEGGDGEEAEAPKPPAQQQKQLTPKELMGWSMRR